MPPDRAALWRLLRQVGEWHAASGQGGSQVRPTIWSARSTLHTVAMAILWFEEQQAQPVQPLEQLPQEEARVSPAPATAAAGELLMMWAHYAMCVPLQVLVLSNRAGSCSPKCPVRAEVRAASALQRAQTAAFILSECPPFFLAASLLKNAAGLHEAEIGCHMPAEALLPPEGPTPGVGVSSSGQGEWQNCSFTSAIPTSVRPASARSALAPAAMPATTSPVTRGAATWRKQTAGFVRASSKAESLQIAAFCCGNVASG